MLSIVADIDGKMSKADGLALATKVRRELTDFWDKLSNLYSTDEVVCELMLRRKYCSDRMYDLLKNEVRLCKFDLLSDILVQIPLSQYETCQYWGLITENGKSLLSGRYIVPIRDINNMVTALVGWFPDERKYITTPTFGFSRDAQFFNIETYSQFADAGRVYLVEGIFDTLSLRSIGLFALGNMGLPLSPIKVEILKRFGHVYAMPDGDKAGRGVLPFMQGSKFKWSLHDNVSFLCLKMDGVKDPDDLVTKYDCDELLANFSDSYIYNIR